MIPAIHVAFGPWSEAVARASWQGAIAVAVGWLVCRLFSRIPPALKCWVWRAVYLKLFISLVPLAPLDLPVLHSRDTAMSVAPLSKSLLAPLEVQRTGVEPSITVALAAPGDPVPDWRECLMIVWVAGVIGYGVPLAIGCRSAVRDRRRSRPAADRWLLDTYAAVARHFAAMRLPQLRLCADPGSPRLVGLFHPAIIVPSTLLERQNRPQLELLLAHELAHHLRRDLWWSWLPAIGRILFWFHPAIWLAQRQWRLAEESACDYAAITATNAPPGDYARMLVGVASQFRQRGRSPVQIAVVDSPHHLKRRLVAMRYMPRWSRGRRMSFALAVCFAAVIAMVPWRLVAQQPDKQGAGGLTEADQPVKDAPSSRPALRPPLHNRESFGRLGVSPIVRHEAWMRDNLVEGRIEAPFAGVSSRAPGVVVEVKVTEGQRVNKGDLMVTLDDARARAAMAEAEAQFKKADVTYQTKEKLRRIGSDSVKPEDVEIAAADRDVAAARIQIARQDLDETRIVAPMSGAVTTCRAAPGQVVSRGALLVQIMDVNRLSVAFSADAVTCPFLRIGQKVRILQAGLPDHPLPAKITFIAPAVDSADGRLRVKATVDDPDHRLKPGMVLEVDLELYPEEDLPH